MRHYREPDQVQYESVFAYPRVKSFRQLAEICHDWPVIAIYADVPSTGWSDLSSALAREGETLLVIEGTPCPGQDVPGWSGLAANPSAEEGLSWERCQPLLRHEPKADVLPWGRRKKDQSLLAGAAFEELLRSCRQRYDRIALVMPMPGERSAPVCPYIPVALLQADAMGRRQLERLQQELCECDVMVLGVLEASALQAPERGDGSV